MVDTRHDHDSVDNTASRPKRETYMEQRLRVARGESSDPEGHHSAASSAVRRRESIMEQRLRVARGEELPADDDDDEMEDTAMDDDSRPKRETLMQRRLRVARGELPDDDDWDEEEHSSDERTPQMHHPHGVPSPYHGAYAPPPGSVVMVPMPAPAQNSGSSLLYLILGLVVIVFIALLLFSGQIVASFQQGMMNSMPSFSSPFAQPTPTLHTSAPAILQRVQHLQRIEVTMYTFQKVIEGSIEGNALQNLLMGDRLVLLAHGTVIAGINLENLRLEDITVSPDGRSVSIQLPPVEIFSVTLNNDLTRVAVREQGILADANPDLETRARQVAEVEILRAACEGEEHILVRAASDSERMMQQLLSMLAFEEIHITSSPIPPCTGPGGTPIP